MHLIFSGIASTMPHMKTIFCLACLLVPMISSSCADAPERKPVGPVSQNSTIPWNTQRPGDGQGQLGLLPQNQFRR